MKVGQKIYCNEKKIEIYADDVPCTDTRKDYLNACEECPHAEEL